MALLHDSGMLHSASDSLQIEMELELALPGWYCPEKARAALDLTST